MVQNKFHFAIAGQTAAEIIHTKADRSKEPMGLSTWKDSPSGRILKSDVTMAKNCPSDKDIRRLERAVSAFFDYMKDLVENENTFTVNSSPSLRNKKDLIEAFVGSVSPKATVDEEWKAFVSRKMADELDQIIADEGLNADETRTFVNNAFRDGFVPTTGTAITKILPPVSRFSKNNKHSATKQAVLDKLAVFFERYFGLS